MQLVNRIEFKKEKRRILVVKELSLIVVSLSKCGVFNFVTFASAVNAVK